MENPREAYKEITLHILSYFQLLEFGLKAYIGHAYSTIKKSVGTKVHFDYTAKDVEEFPLERLLSIFSKLNANKELIKRLNKLRAERNHLAHNSLIIVMGSKYDAGAIEDRLQEYYLLEGELTDCLNLVIEESQSLMLQSKI